MDVTFRPHIKNAERCWCKNRVVFYQSPLFYIRSDGEIEKYEEGLT